MVEGAFRTTLCTPLFVPSIKFTPDPVVVVSFVQNRDDPINWLLVVVEFHCLWSRADQS